MSQHIVSDWETSKEQPVLLARTCREVLQDFVNIVLSLSGGGLTPVTTAQSKALLAACTTDREELLMTSLHAAAYTMLEVPPEFVRCHSNRHHKGILAFAKV